MVKEDNRSQIVTQALLLFSSKGYDAVGVQELVKAANVSKPTLYYYFGSKKGLLETLLKEKFEPFISELTRLTEYNGDLPEMLRNIARHYFHFAVHESELYKLHLPYTYPIPENEAYLVMKPWIEVQQNLFEEMFRNASKDHGNMAGRHLLYSNSFLFFLNGFISVIYNENLNVDEELIWSAIQQFSYGLYS